MDADICVLRVNEERYDELMQTLDDSFSFYEVGKKFIDLLPKLYKKKYTPWKNNIAVLENDKMAAAVGLYYSEMHVCGENLRYGGIGNVAVLPDYRRKGYMKLAMKAAIEEMKQNGTDFCILDGQRQRYQHFGFENAGTGYIFQINKSNMEHVFGIDRKSDLRVIALCENDSEALDLIDRWNRERPIHSERARDSLFDLLCSWHAKPYRLVRNGEMIGYCVLSEDKSTVEEMVLRSADDLEAAVIAIEQLSGAEDIRYRFCAYEYDYCDFFNRIAAGTNSCGSCKMAVYNYKRTITAFLKARALVGDLPELSFTCLIHGDAGDENLAIMIKDGVSDVKEHIGAADIELTALEAIRFFFGGYSKERRQLSHDGCGVFPLPFYQLSADHV